MRSFFVCILLAGATLIYGQEIKVRGGFVQDSLKIGQNVSYWLSASYPKNLDLILPDSNFNFTPFEFAERRYFETLGDSVMARDSVVYGLQSFEIEPIQYLNLPAIILDKEDSTIITSPLDSIFLIELVEVATDTTALLTNTDHQRVAREFNSPLLMFSGGALVVIALIVLIVFGKKIRRHFKLKRMARAHDQFLDDIAQLISSLKIAGKPDTAEQAINLWRRYLEKLEGLAFTKFTSKEISKLPFAEELKDPLTAVDRCVYGKLESGTVYQDFQHLEDFAENRYAHQVNKLISEK